MKNASPLLSAGRLPVRSGLILPLFILHFSYVFASFNVCNQSDQKAIIALGYFEHGEWQARGWWEAEPGECVRLLPSLSGRYYYLYAYCPDGGLWAGDTPFCIAEENFVLKKNPACNTQFFQVDTQDQGQWTHFLHRENNRYYSEGDGRCDIVGELTERAATYLELFAGQFLTAMIVREESLSLTPGADLQFSILRDGPVRVKAGPRRSQTGAFILDLPIRIVRTQIKWREEIDGKTSWRKEKIQDQSITLQYTVNLQYTTGAILLSPAKKLKWDREPFYYFMDKKVDLHRLATPSIERSLHQMTRLWAFRFHSIFEAFTQGDCGWQEEIAKAIQAINAYERSQVGKTLTPRDGSLARQGR